MSKTSLYAAILQFVVSSVGMMLGNKLAVQALPLAGSLVIIQSIGTLLLLFLFCFKKVDRFSPKIAMEWLPIAFLFAFMLYTSLKSFVLVGVATILIFRNAGAIVTTVVEYLVRGEKVNVEIVVAELTIVLGAFMYAHGGSAVSSEGFTWVALNIVGQVTYGVLLKSRMDRKPHMALMSKYTMSMYNNLLALPFVAGVVYVEQEYITLPIRLVMVSNEGWMWIAATCALGFFISTSGFGLQKEVSATTFMVINNCAKFLNIALSWMYLGDKITGWVDGSGCALALLAGLWYSSAVSRKKKPSLKFN